MDGQPFQASKFATTLRRYLFRKHLGLLRPQDMRKPDGHFIPAPAANDYDLGSAEDKLVADPVERQLPQALERRSALEHIRILKGVCVDAG
jgi:phospholipase D1/2